MYQGTASDYYAVSILRPYEIDRFKTIFKKRTGISIHPYWDVRLRPSSGYVRVVPGGITVNGYYQIVYDDNGKFSGWKLIYDDGLNEVEKDVTFPLDMVAKTL